MPKMRKDKELFRKRNRPKDVDANAGKTEFCREMQVIFPKTLDIIVRGW